MDRVNNKINVSLEFTDISVEITPMTYFELIRNRANIRNSVDVTQVYDLRAAHKKHRQAIPFICKQTKPGPFNTKTKPE